LRNNNSKSGEPISSRRANNRLTNISSFFSWCEKERDLINSNVFYGKSLPVTNDDEGRERFTEEDLLTIFTNKRFTKPDKKRMFNYWVPIIAYYSGMRLAEISFLRKQDIIQVNGIWAFAIKPFQIDDKKRTIKNKKSTRTIPIHSDIIKLGFLDYVESCKGELLFDTKRANHKHDDAIGKSFGVFKKKLGLPEGKVFHAFRMTFMDIAAQQNLDLVLIKDFVVISSGM
jgi:integrase